eukprot:COSAG06_NODE_26894_length_605_cov_0.920949_1_plen_88_part_10
MRGGGRTDDLNIPSKLFICCRRLFLASEIDTIIVRREPSSIVRSLASPHLTSRPRRERQILGLRSVVHRGQQLDHVRVIYCPRIPSNT